VDFAEYVADRRRTLYRFAYLLSGDPGVADDVVAEVLTRMFERRDQIRGADHVHAYVRKMVLNEYLAHRRRSWRVSPISNIAYLMDAAVMVDDHADRYADRVRLATAIRTLPPRQRAAVVLRYYEGLAFHEIASLLDASENAVRSNVSRALRRLRVRLDDDDVEARALKTLPLDDTAGAER
jgi:RNA polymerase sigma-70 factor (sigma-E family)